MNSDNKDDGILSSINLTLLDDDDNGQADFDNQISVEDTSSSFHCPVHDDNNTNLVILPCSLGHLACRSCFSIDNICRYCNDDDGQQPTIVAVATLPRTAQQWSQFYLHKQSIWQDVEHMCRTLVHHCLFYREMLLKLKMKLILRRMFDCRRHSDVNVFAITQPKLSPRTLEPYANFYGLKSAKDIELKLEKMLKELDNSVDNLTTRFRQYFAMTCATYLYECRTINWNRAGVSLVQLAVKPSAEEEEEEDILQDLKNTVELTDLQKFSRRVDQLREVTTVSQGCITVTSSDLSVINECVLNVEKELILVADSLCSTTTTNFMTASSPTLCLNCEQEYDRNLMSFSPPAHCYLTKRELLYLSEKSHGLCYLCGAELMRNYRFEEVFRNNDRPMWDNNDWNPPTTSSNCPAYSELTNNNTRASPPPYDAQEENMEVVVAQENEEEEEEERSTGLRRLFAS